MKNILVVDDSALMRRVISDIINSDEELQTNAYASDGLQALKFLEGGKKFDAIILDMIMPKMTGVEFLRAIRDKGYQEKVIIVSTIAKEGARETIEALELGAFDFVTKPGNLSDARSDAFSARLRHMIYLAVGLEWTKDKEQAPSDVSLQQVRPGIKRPARKKLVFSSEKQAGKVSKADRSRHSQGAVGRDKRKLVALACSTGGPKALQSVIPYLPADLDAPVIIVQHMPVGFTASLGKRLDELGPIRVKEAEDGEMLRKGTVYIAKGGCQMRVGRRGAQEYCLSVTEEAARNGLRPCADIMYESLMHTGFDDITCVVMTGMGADGTKGILQLEKTNQIYVIAQNEATCTVYGMPKAIAEAGAVDEVQELKNIADAITKHVGVQ